MTGWVLPAVAALLPELVNLVAQRYRGHPLGRVVRYGLHGLALLAVMLAAGFKDGAWQGFRQVLEGMDMLMIVVLVWAAFALPWRTAAPEYSEHRSGRRSPG